MGIRKKVIVVGAGARGRRYAELAADMGEEFEIVGVAEPITSRRLYLQDRCSIPAENCYDTWEPLLERPKFADLVMICNMDRDHYAPVMKAIEKGYNILLEKPMGATAKECAEITRAAEKAGVFVLVCHVLRFSAFFCALKKCIDDGMVGDIVHIQHAENVGHIHQSHSFVRGNWRNSKESTPMIVQKTCHDMDILQWLVGKDCSRVHSFGSLTYFTEKNAPEGSPNFCADGCPIGETCYYNAVKLYLGEKKRSGIVQAATGKLEPTSEEIMDALHCKTLGRCVFKCDNDVVDHQTVNLEFEGGVTASFSMCAFNEGEREIRIMGTKGEIRGNMGEDHLNFFDFADRTNKTILIKNAVTDQTIDGGHGGGDPGIISALCAVMNGDYSNISICTIDQTYKNHLIAFAAEESRLTGKVVDIKEYERGLFNEK